jgi:hypothetical protein
MEERLRVFFAELGAQWVEILKLHSSIEGKVESLKIDIDNENLIDSLGYKLHNLYSAYEDCFKLVARFFENQIEDMARYHTDLLKRMLIEIEGVRPNFLCEESFKILDELKGFRHLFRHAYSYELTGDRLIKLAEKSMTLKEIFREDFENFNTKLKSG